MFINGIEIPDDTQALKLEPSPELDIAIIEYDEENDILVYDVETLIECYVNKGMTYEEAWDWYSYNTVRTGNYVKNYPRFVYEEI